MHVCDYCIFDQINAATKSRFQRGIPECHVAKDNTWNTFSIVITSASACSSSPLLSLSHKYQWNKPSTCPYITYIQGSRQDRTTGNWRKWQHYMRKGRRKKNVTPRLCSIMEYSARTEKNTSAQKHIYHKHITWQQRETHPALASSRPVRCTGLSCLQCSRVRMQAQASMWTMWSRTLKCEPGSTETTGTVVTKLRNRCASRLRLR